MAKEHLIIESRMTPRPCDLPVFDYPVSPKENYKLLLEGNTYNQVMAQADISSATLSRVSRCVQYGSGYSKLLKKD